MPVETLQHQEATRRYNNAISTIRKGLFEGSRFIPRGTTDLMRIIDRHMALVTDEQYLVEIERRLLPSSAPAALALNQMEIAQSPQAKATYFSPSQPDEQRSIVIRESFIADPGNSDEFILQVLLEELAHAYYSGDAFLPYSDLPETGVSLLPNSTKDGLEHDLKTYRREYYGRDDDLDLNNVVWHRDGFCTKFFGSDLTPDGFLALYPGPQIQLAYEEARALILQTIFLSKVFGTIKKRYGSVSEQIIAGIQEINYGMKYQGRFKQYGIQSKGLRFVHEYCTGQNFSKQVSDLMERLHNGDPDSFLTYLQNMYPENYNYFMELVQYFLDR